LRRQLFVEVFFSSLWLWVDYFLRAMLSAQHKPLPEQGLSAWHINYVLGLIKSFDMDPSHGGIFAYVYKV
jgi:hypothetical protein